MKTKKEIILTEKEAVTIAQYLETLEAMSGTADEHFSKECIKAGKHAKKIRYLLKH